MEQIQKKYWITSKLNSNTAEVFLYGYIDPYDVSAGDFIKEFRQLEKEFTNINVRINSGGGSVFEGLAIFNAMRQSDCNIETFVDGLAASMASVIALAGKKCNMSKSAMIMTHQPTVGSWGNSEEHKKNAQLLDGLEQTMLAIYCAKTGKTTEECKSAFMNGKDNWFTAEEAKAAGLVDNIYDAPGIEAPEEKKDAKNVWQLYSKQQFAAKFTQNQNENMELKLSAASLAALNITAVTDSSAVDNAITALKTKADMADAMKTQKEKAEQDLKDLQDANIKKEVSSQLDKAIDEKRITVEQRTVFEKQYAEKPEELKELLATMKPFESKVVATNADATDAVKAELAGLMAKSGKELWTSGKLVRLKELNKEAWKAKYKEAFDEDPEEDAK